MLVLKKPRTLARRIRSRFGGFGGVVPPQLENREFQELAAAVTRRRVSPRLTVIEVGTGTGRGSTVSLVRALEQVGREFSMYSYEPDVKMHRMAAQFWRNDPRVRVINEFFLKPGDIETIILPLISDAQYVETYRRYRDMRTMLSTLPRERADLVFVDSVRYSHLAILLNVLPVSHPDCWYLVEDDIPDLGELAFLRRHLEISGLEVHRLGNHQWPILVFQARLAVS